MQNAEKPELNDNLNLEQMFGEAEQTLRKGLETLSEWGDQARNVMQNRPGVVLASLSIAGFMTGLLLRQGKLNPRQMSTRSFTADPMVMFLTGAIAGFTLGPRVIRDLTQAYEKQGATDAHISPIARKASELNETSDTETFNRR